MGPSYDGNKKKRALTNNAGLAVTTPLMFDAMMLCTSGVELAGSKTPHKLCRTVATLALDASSGRPHSQQRPVAACPSRRQHRTRLDD